MVDARREKARLTFCPCKPETFWLFKLRYWYHQTLKRVSCVPVTINRHPQICTLPIIQTHPSPSLLDYFMQRKNKFWNSYAHFILDSVIYHYFLTSSIKTIHDLAFTSRTCNKQKRFRNIKRCGLRVVPLSFTSTCVTRGKLAARNQGLEGLSDVRLLEYRNSSIAVPLPFLCV